jgi:hypothetical protein
MCAALCVSSRLRVCRRRRQNIVARAHRIIWRLARASLSGGSSANAVFASASMALKRRLAWQRLVAAARSAKICLPACGCGNAALGKDQQQS